MMSWLRRWLGESREMAELRREVIALRAEVAAARACAAGAVASQWRAGRRAALLRGLVDRLIEPGQVDECSKVRLRDRLEAEQFARSAEHDRGLPTGALMGYRCMRCPRQPVSLARYWHITHTDPAQRGLRGTQHRLSGPGLLSHITPDTVRLLRAKVAS